MESSNTSRVTYFWSTSTSIVLLLVIGFLCHCHTSHTPHREGHTCPFKGNAAATMTFICPLSEGYFPESSQCDTYFHCQGGQSQRRFCPDGQFFDDRLIHYPRIPCTNPGEVHCGTRTRSRVKRLPRIGRR